MSDPQRPINRGPKPAAPEANISEERERLATERWAFCPLNNCKHDTNLLYEDFMLRGIRSNRLMCSACVVKTDAGYMAKEVAKASEDRFFTGSFADDVLMLLVMIVGSIGANFVAGLVGGFSFAFAIGVGAAVGAAMAGFARQLAGKRVTRRTQWFGVAGIILGAILTPTVTHFLLTGEVLISLNALFNINILLCTGSMIAAAYGIFARRISF